MHGSLDSNGIPCRLNLFDIYRYQCLNSRGTVVELETTRRGLVLADAPPALRLAGASPCLMYGKAVRHRREVSRAGAAVSVV